jgi:hypothetical protein
MTVPLPDSFDHDAWQTAIGTVLAYGLILVAMFLLLFVFPFVVFESLGVA